MAAEKYTISATIYDKYGKIVSKAINNYNKTHPKQKYYAEKAGEPYRQALHAEIAAIIRAKGKGHSIFIERFNKHGQPRLAAPCKICQLAIKESGLKEIRYTVG